MGWGVVLKFRPRKKSSIKERKINKYDSGTYNTAISSTDTEILAAIKSLEKFKLFVISATEFTLRTDCQAIVLFYHKKIRK